MARDNRQSDMVKVLAREMIDLSNEVFVQLLRSPELRRGGLSRLEFLVLRELAERGPLSAKQLRERFGLVP